MIKFYKEDIKYIKRTGWAGLNYTYKYQYHFSVRGESANYLINAYGLFGKDVELHYFSDDYVTVTSKNPNNSTESDVTEINKEDIDELLNILLEDIKEDLRQWEEYCCDSEYYMWDTRWEE